MGLAASYHALKAGHDVSVFEADKVPGGMAAHLDCDGLSIERFYHFVCKADHSTFELMEDLGIGHQMKWRQTSMGYFIDGEYHRWGDPISLLRFPKLSLIAKLRYGLQMFLATRRSNWRKLEHLTAKEWFVSGAGQKTYDVLWRRLLELKFFEFSDDISAAWIWARIKRLGTSRRSIFQEELGYIEGGSQTLVDALVAAIARQGGEIKLGASVEKIVCDGERVKGVQTNGEFHAFEAVIATVPTPFISRLVPDLSTPTKAAYDAINNIGVVCVLLKLKRSVVDDFWLNISDSRIDIPGLVEFSNLRPVKDTIVYVPYYMPKSHPKFGREDDTFVNEAINYLQIINPTISRDDLLASRVGRLKHAQPVCEPGFLTKIPPIQSEITGLQIADTCFYYPEDRGISESVRFGKMMADAIMESNAEPKVHDEP